MLIKTLNDLLIANAFWRNLFVLVRWIASPPWGPDHNRPQFYFLKCWHLSKCSHGMFACFVDWHFLLVTGLSEKAASRPSPTACRQRAITRRRNCVRFLFCFPLAPPPPGPLPPLDFDTHIILADFYHLTGLGDIPSKIKLSHPGFVQKFSVLQLLTAFFILLHSCVINSGFLSYFMFNYRTQAATLIEVGLHCHSSLF